MQKPVEKPIKFKKNLETKGKSYPITHVSAVIDDNGESIKSTIDSLKNKSSMTEVTWQELKDKRDAGKLTPGSLYRITDYQCTTAQENTRSAGHQFDIVLLALSENKLAEEGWAMEHSTDIYDVTFYDGFTKKCYLYVTDISEDDDKIYESWNLIDIDTMLGRQLDDVVRGESASIDDNNKQVSFRPGAVNPSTFALDTPNLTYNYFQNSNLSAWKVWYCLDNDTARFAWADDGETPTIVIEGTEFPRSPQYDNLADVEGLYAWGTDPDNIGIWFTNTENPNVGYGVLDSEGLESGDVISTIKGFGRGVIYRLIDEWNNDIKYDFKNIQFKRKLTDGQYDATNGTETWCYTLNIWYNDMCQDASIVGNTLPNDEGFINGVYDNKFGYTTAYDLYFEGVNTFAFALGNNVVLSVFEGGYYGIYSNIIRDSSKGNSIGTEFYSNIIGTGFLDNVIGNGFNYNTIGNNFSSNIIGRSFNSNTIGHNFYSNTIGNNFSTNMVGINFNTKTISDNTEGKNYGNNGVELATKS